MGVGDLAVPKRMRRFGEAFYGCRAAYGAALAAAGTQALEKALARNIFEVVTLRTRRGEPVGCRGGWRSDGRDSDFSQP
jgi:hypothetical protein